MGAQVEQMLTKLENFVNTCTMCPLGRQVHTDKPIGFNQHVFSTKKTSKFMIVGQNPGHNECLVHEPFVGEAGQMFNEQVQAMGLSRDDFYISNAVKCYTAKNVKPDVEYACRCEPILRLELNILRPVLVVTLGAVAFDAFCPNLAMGKSLGQIVHSEKFGVDVYPIYHPSPRNMSVPSRKKQFIEDVKTLCKLMIAYRAKCSKP